MTRALILIVLLLTGIGSATAADMSYRPGHERQSVYRPGLDQPRVLPFPRSERAQSVWASSACWSECGSYCAWGQAGCLTRDAQGHCLQLTDSCDRYCQRQCRTSGGPLLPLDF